MARIIEIRNPKNCPPSLELKVGDLLVFGATGGHVQSGPDTVLFLGPFLTGTVGKDGKIITPIGTPSTVVFLARGPGTATVDVVTGDPFITFDTTTLGLTQTDPQLRIARESSGYWSYLGTDILSIPSDQQTMNLQDFSMGTPESEFFRVVRHETGHTLGFPHEHMRQELVDKIDRAKAIAFFERTQGWSEQEVIQQVLTPIEESSLLGTPHADPNSIMCYQIPGSITKDGQPIVGGFDIDQSDFDFAASI